MQSIFLDASILNNREEEERNKIYIQRDCIQFEFPDGFEQLRLIEECRALNALDVSDADNFDLMYDITMQMLSGKIVAIYFVKDTKRFEMSRFVVTNRYMNLRSVDVIDEYPILVNWLVEWVAGYLGKKYPRSLEVFQATMSEKREHLKSLKV